MKICLFGVEEKINPPLIWRFLDHLTCKIPFKIIRFRTTNIYLNTIGLSRHSQFFCKFFLISIHLMLRFINRRTIKLIRVRRISIHLMLRFIVCTCLKADVIFVISIHLMLRFILQRTVDNIPKLRISIHLMLRFISFRTLHDWRNQNISIHLMLRFIPLSISCTYAPLKFQYISCYGLSRSSRKRLGIRFNFNTSHVTVYQERQQNEENRGQDFNTSHVTVYRNEENRRKDLF